MNARAFNKTLMFSYNDFNTNYNLIIINLYFYIFTMHFFVIILFSVLSV
jgi:hypothetical protein